MIPVYLTLNISKQMCNNLQKLLQKEAKTPAQSPTDLFWFDSQFTAVKHSTDQSIKK